MSNDSRMATTQVANLHTAFNPVVAEIMENQKYARRCDFTGEGMNEGWCICDGDSYAKYESDALKTAKEMGYDSIEDAYENQAMYYTEWEVSEDDEYYYMMIDGKLMEVTH